MKLKPSKCEFHKEETEYLGFIINSEGVMVDPVKTNAIWEWETPAKKWDIQCFMGFCNFYRRFIEGFSKIGKPLYNLTKKNQKWNWTDKEQQAFDELRTRLTSAPVLVHYDPTRRIMIETDASKYVCVGILLQECEDGIW